ncbi:hypothetical protein [Arthrobacter sp. HMWF013]|nr:hypothetical protein [Arthrobacter sp. HMWF013]
MKNRAATLITALLLAGATLTECSTAGTLVQGTAPGFVDSLT